MGRKHLFSLIEIAVAMAVAAIGVAAIMALLPISLKSTSDSVGDTLAADVANSVIAQLDSVAWEDFDLIQELPTSEPGKFGVEKCLNYAEEKKSSSDYYLIAPSDGLQKGHFVFMFGPKNKPADFAAEVRCWRREEESKALPLTILNVETGKYRIVDAADIKHNSKTPLVRLQIEVSWPITKVYKRRESRTFIREYLDPTYYKEVKD